MPLTTDPKILALSQQILDQFHTLFGSHPGYRPVHAKGLLLEGDFTPSAQASTLSRAPHLQQASTPVFLRFSNSTGVPILPDNDANANPRGCALRFQIGQHTHTDIIAHSTDGFPTHTADEFLELLRAIAQTSQSKSASPSPIEKFLGTHPKALAYVQSTPPAPSSFARENYYGVTAMRFTNAQGVSRFGRFRIVPPDGADHPQPAAAAGSPNYLFEELEQRIARGPIPLLVQVQLAEEGDVVDDATTLWPQQRTVLDLGTVRLTRVTANNAQEQQQIIFDPIPRIDGIEPSADPLLEVRAAIYLISGRLRRSAPATEAPALAAAASSSR